MAKVTPPNSNKLLSTYLTPEECRKKALALMALAMKAGDRRSANRFKKVAHAWEELADELAKG